MLLELVYQSLYQAVNKMIQYWERFLIIYMKHVKIYCSKFKNEAKEFEGKQTQQMYTY